MVREYILYKQPIQYETLHIVQYLHFLGISLLPKHCIERSYPDWVTALPSIYVPQTGEQYIGLDECVLFFEQESGVQGILEESTCFKQKHPEYRISMHWTKNLIILVCPRLRKDYAKVGLYKVSFPTILLTISTILLTFKTILFAVLLIF